MSNCLPIVSIIVPSFNRADLIGQTIESVLAQTCPNWELVIVDDHSTDDTANVVNSYRLKDSRIRFAKRSSPIKGAPACRNEGVLLSSGDLLIFLDSDDLLAPHCIEHRLRFMAGHSEIELLISQTELFEKKPGDLGLLYNRFDYDNDLDRFLMNDNLCLTTGPTWRRSAFEKIAGWDESLPCWQDWELNVRALASGLRYYKLDEVDSYFRTGHIQRQAISGEDKMTTPGYVMGALGATRKVLDTLQATGQATPYRHDLLAFNIFELLHRMAIAKRNRDARRLARQACRQGILSRKDVLHFAILSRMLSTVQLLERGAEWWEERRHKEARDWRPKKLRGRIGKSTELGARNPEKEKG